MSARSILLSMFLVGSLCTSLCGCAAVIAGGAAGAGAVSYLKGEFSSSFDAPVDVSYQAAVRAMSALKFQVIETTNDAIQGHIIARDSQNRRVEITLKAEIERKSSITIRVGVFGDELASKLIHEKIAEEIRLGAAPAEVASDDSKS